MLVLMCMRMCMCMGMCMCTCTCMWVLYVHVHSLSCVCPYAALAHMLALMCMRMCTYVLPRHVTNARMCPTFVMYARVCIFVRVSVCLYVCVRSTCRCHTSASRRPAPTGPLSSSQSGFCWREDDTLGSTNISAGVRHLHHSAAEASTS